MMDPYTMRKLVKSCSYKPGWAVDLKWDGTGDEARPYIQVSVDETAEASMDSRPPFKRAPWKGGKRYLSYHMCRQEVVGAVFDALKAAEMHEASEWFRYKGAPIYNQHLDPDVLAEVAKKASSFNVRENAMDPK